MANLSRYAQTIVLYDSSSVDVGGTGVALVLSTAGSSGTGAFTSTPGGYPWTSTSLNPAIPLAGFEGVRFTAIAHGNNTTGLGSGTSGIWTLQAYFALSSTSSSTTWVAIKDAYATSYSTATASQGIAPSTNESYMQVDVYRPAVFAAGYAAVGAIVQSPSCSGGVTLIADRYGARKYTFTGSTAFSGVAASTVDPKAQNITVSVNGTS